MPENSANTELSERFYKPQLTKTICSTEMLWPVLFVLAQHMESSNLLETNDQAKPKYARPSEIPFKCNDGPTARERALRRNDPA